MNPWEYSAQSLDTIIIENYVGFVYLITNLTNDRKYVGKKLFTKRKSKQVKGKKKRFSVESDWQTYYGSNAELLADVELLGTDSFKREILYLCKSKGECSYCEASEQFHRNVLYDTQYYNQWIQCKIHKKHLKKLPQPLSAS